MIAPINITIFKRGPGGSLAEEVATSGPYVDQQYGVKIGTTMLDPNIYVVVVSTYSADFVGDFEIRVYAEKQIELTPV